MAAIFGKKLGMTQVFEASGRRVPVTVVEAGPCVVLQVKTPESDQYAAVQVGFMERDIKKANKPMAGHFKKAGKSAYRAVGEFRVPDASAYKPGQVLTAELFKPGDVVDVVGTSKGKGFAGAIKRHKFGRGPKTHGSKNIRPPGSIGTSATPSRVLPGRKMPGHLGDRQVTIQRLKIHEVDAERNLLLILGAVPGARNNVITIKSTVKPKRTDTE